MRQNFDTSYEAEWDYKLFFFLVPGSIPVALPAMAVISEVSKISPPKFLPNS
jgi:hypothetical protein